MESVAGLRAVFKPVNNFIVRPISSSTMDVARAPYSGPSRKLIVALDIGTTFSGAAYAFLDPGEIPRIQSVTRHVFSFSSTSSISYVTRGRYLNNPNSGSAKVPSTLYYDQDGTFMGVDNGVDFQDDDYLKIRWWEIAIRSIVQEADDRLGGSRCSRLRSRLMQ